jgi:hypothetical protein
LDLIRRISLFLKLFSDLEFNRESTPMDATAEGRGWREATAENEVNGNV